MNRAQLEHVIRAAATITADREIVVIGSTSILGQFPDAPDEMLRSREADVYPLNHPDRFELLHVIGEFSPFHETFGYYADPVEAALPKFPSRWKDRLIRVPVAGIDGRVDGLCPEVHDLVLSKYAAFREKDRDFVRAGITYGLVHQGLLLDRLSEMDLEPSVIETLREQIESDFASAPGCPPPSS